jgi:hypothetical protein
MASIIKVDTIQHSDGSAPTMAELGLDVSGSILQVKSSTFTGVQSNAKSQAKGETHGKRITGSLRA